MTCMVHFEKCASMSVFPSVHWKVKMLIFVSLYYSHKWRVGYLLKYPSCLSVCLSICRAKCNDQQKDVSIHQPKGSVESHQTCSVCLSLGAFFLMSVFCLPRLLWCLLLSIMCVSINDEYGTFWEMYMCIHLSKYICMFVYPSVDL